MFLNEDEITDQARSICSTSGPLLVIGELGTGKEFAAKHISEKVIGYPPSKYFSVDCNLSFSEFEKALLGYRNMFPNDFLYDELHVPGLLEQAVEGVIYFNRIHLASEDVIKLIKSIFDKEPYKPQNSEIKMEIGNIYYFASCEPHPFNGILGNVHSSLVPYFQDRHIVLLNLRSVNDLENLVNDILDQFSTDLTIDIDEEFANLIYSIPNNFKGLKSILKKISESPVHDNKITSNMIKAQLDEINRFAPKETTRKFLCNQLAANVVYQRRPITGSMIYEWISQFDRYSTDSKIDPRDIAEILIKKIIETYYYSNRRLDNVISRLSDNLLEEIKKEVISELESKASNMSSSQFQLTLEGHLKYIQKEGLYYTSVLGPMRSPDNLANILRSKLNLKPGSNAVNFSDLPQIVKKKGGHIRVLLLDDFVGSGNQLKNEVIQKIDGFDELRNAIQKNKNSKISFYILICVGFDIGIELVQSHLMKNFWFGLHLLVGDVLSSKDRTFQDESSIFPQSEIRSIAEKMITEDIGNIFFKNNHPRGWNNIEGLVVFENNVPNNTLPIVWKNVTLSNANWNALFPRLTVK